jgi:hypothetical protein
MKLSNFLIGLSEGRTLVANELHPFDDTDCESALDFLRKFYDHDRVEVAGTAPVFDQTASLWAAKYLYRSFQILLLRKLGPEHIKTELTDYTLPQTAESVYSADLMLRYLPMVFNLAKRLAPEDPLVLRLKRTAERWPLSSVGCEIDHSAIDIAVILSHPSLSTLYADRIIEAKDKKRVITEAEQNLILSVLGNYAELLWPGFEIPSNVEMNYGK